MFIFTNLVCTSTDYFQNIFFPQTKLSERENQYILRKIQINNAENTMKSLLSDLDELTERVCIQFLELPSEKGLSWCEPSKSQTTEVQHSSENM